MAKIPLPMHLVGYDMISHYRREDQLKNRLIQKQQDRKEAKIASVWLVLAVLSSIAALHVLSLLN